MRALIWKELRENAKWAVLAMLAFGGALYYGLTYSEYGYVNYADTNDGVTLCRKTFLMATTFGCPAVGLLLGFLQILPELKRDRWAALLHRPVRKGVLLTGKAVAGGILYLLATLLPFTAMVWLVAKPGMFPSPFLPGMMKPGLADIAGGLAYYFAALAMSLQKGGPLLVRGLPFLAAVFVSYVLLETGFFSVAMEAAMLMSVLLFVSAWGSIESPHLLARRAWICRAAYLGMLLYGFFGLGGLTWSFVQTVKQPAPNSYARYELLEDGLPVLLKYEDGRLQSAEAVDGTLLEGPRYAIDRIGNLTTSPNTLCLFVGDDHGWKQGAHLRPYRDSDAYLWANIKFTYPRPEIWYQILESNHLAGFSMAGNQAVDILDRRGFRNPLENPHGFPPEVELESFGSDKYVVAGPESVRIFSLGKREERILELPFPGRVYGQSHAWARTETGSVEVIAVAQGSGVTVYDKEGNRLAVLPYQRDVDRWGTLSLAINKTLDRFFLWHSPSSWIPFSEKRGMPSYVDVFDAGGRRVREYTLPPLPERKWGRTWDSVAKQCLKAPAFFWGTMAYRKIGAEWGSERLRKDLERQWGAQRKGTWEIIRWTSAASMACACFVFIWARRHFSRKRALAWAALSLGFNLAGLLVFCLAADWPTRVACPSCRKLRPAEREDCPSCSAGWPRPAANGTEILEDAAT